MRPHSMLGGPGVCHLDFLFLVLKINVFPGSFSMRFNHGIYDIEID